MNSVWWWERLSGELKIFKEEGMCSLGMEVGRKRETQTNVENQMGTRSWSARHASLMDFDVLLWKIGVSTKEFSA